jgi:DNA polymerase III subunit alpha
MTDFVHLHNHSYYSLMDGLNSPRELLLAAKDLGQKGVAFTDHGTLSSHRDAQRAALDLDMKPILGLEAYISPTDRFDRRAVKARDDNTQLYNHLIIVAKDAKGLKNLNTLSEKAWTEGYYYKPRIDREILAQHRDGLIVLSGCMNGLIAKEIERENMDGALELAEWFKSTFGEDFYMEVQPHNPKELNDKLLEVADYFNISPVVTTDCHFARKEDRWVEEAMLILSTSPSQNKEATYDKARSMEIFERLRYLYPDRAISFEEIDVYIMGRGDIQTQMEKQGIDRTDIYDNSVKIMDQVGEYPFPQGLDLLPRPKTDPDKRLRELVEHGMKVRGLAGRQEYEDRKNNELSVIESKKFPAYFLVAHEMIMNAKKNGIMVGPGRGSGAGSLVNYCLFLTEVDPIKYGLLFERFINEERNDFPDIDTDFEDRRRKEVKEYLVKKFKNVASISTFSTFADKGVVRDAARVFAVPLGDVNKALKTVERFEDYEVSPNTAEFRKKYPEVTDLARRLRGRIRGVGMHAGGVVVANQPIYNLAPIETRKEPNSVVDQRIPVVALDMGEVESIGMIKFDALGLKTLSVISDTVKSIKEIRGEDIDLLAIDLDDPKVMATLSKGFTKGVFQAEATPYTNLLVKMGVDDFNDLVASNALVRPGAMNTVGSIYVARKQGREQVRYVHPILEPFTKDTYGVIIYQEQVMQACVNLAGMSWSDADKIRKIIGKKKDVHEFDIYKDRFIEGASKHIDARDAEHLWHDFEAHAGYSFNKSHAVAYSMLTMWTAWLKYYYPLEFMTALLRNEGDKDAVTEYLIEAKRLGLRVLLPHVNESGINFEIQDDAIRFGLGNIKYISEKSAPHIIKNRPFINYEALKTLADQKGSGINSRMVGALNAVGAASFPDNPRSGREKDNFYEYLNIPAFDTSKVTADIQAQVTKAEDFEESGCFVMMGMVKKIKRAETWARVEFVDETGAVGVFVNPNTAIETGQMYIFLVGDNRIHRYVPVDELDREDDTFVQFLRSPALDIAHDKYFVLDFTNYKTKQNKMMAHVVLAKADKSMKRVLVFSKNYALALGKMRPGTAVSLVLGTMKDDGTVFVKEIKND